MRYLLLIIVVLTAQPIYGADLNTDEPLTDFIQKVDQPFSGSQSPDEARIAGIAKGKAEALERAGTYIESYSLVKNFVLEKDESLALTAGILTTEVISQENYATTTGFGIRLTLKVSIDKSIVSKRLKQIKTDQSLMRKYKELQVREATLLARIKALESKTASQSQTYITPLGEAQTYRKTVQALPAVELNRKALTLWQDGRFSDPEAALTILNEAYKLDPQNPLTMNNRGVVLFLVGKRQDALTAFAQAIHLNPNYSDAYSNRGITLMAEQNYKGAQIAFSQVIELNPMRVDAYINRAVARKNLWQFDLALEDYQRVLAIDPERASRQDALDSANLDFKELDRICDKAQRACQLGLCRGLNDLRQQKLCTDKK